MHNLLLFDHLYRVRFLTKFSTRMNFPWITNRKWNGLAFTTFILATFWLKLDVGWFKHNGVVVWDILPWVDWSIVDSFRSPRLQQQAFGHARRRKSLQIEQIWQWRKQNCHHLHHVVNWVWKLLINITILVWSLHNWHQEILKLCHKINQDKHTHKSQSFPTPSITLYNTTFPPLQGLCLGVH